MKNYCIILMLTCTTVLCSSLNGADDAAEKPIAQQQIQNNEQAQQQAAAVEDDEFKKEWNSFKEQFNQIIENFEKLTTTVNQQNSQLAQIATAVSPEEKSKNIETMKVELRLLINDALNRFANTITQTQAQNLSTQNATIKQEFKTINEAINKIDTLCNAHNTNIFKLHTLVTQLENSATLKLQKKATKLINTCIKNKNLSNIKKYLNPKLFKSAECSPEYRVNALLNYLNIDDHIKNFGKSTTCTLISCLMAEALSFILHKEILKIIPHAIFTIKNKQVHALHALQGLIGIIIGCYVKHCIHVYSHNTFVNALQTKITALKTTIEQQKDNSFDNQITDYTATYTAQFNS